MFTRYAVYYTPAGALASKGACWLGWDVAAGSTVAHPDSVGLDLAEITQTPRKYGFHGTIKPPFALAEGAEPEALRMAFATLCDSLHPVEVDALGVSRLGRFLALTPRGDASDLAALAAKAVRDLDSFRAPPSEAELEKRRKGGLSPAQEENLRNWGYPYVMDQFRFHLTLSGRMKDLGPVAEAAETYFADALTAPYRFDALALVGERPDGMFETIERRGLGR